MRGAFGFPPRRRAEPVPRALLSWSRVTHVRFGPTTEDNRAERIHFWPDRRGIGLRQVQRILGTADETATSAQSLAAKSVAVQGFGALEFVLHGTGAEALPTAAPHAFRCRYGAAVAANLASVADTLSRAWGADGRIAALLAEPGPENPLFRDRSEALAEILGVLTHGLEAIRDQKILPMLGASAADARPALAIFRRSGLTVAVLRAEFGGLRDLYDVSGLGSALPQDSVERTFGALTLPVAEAVTDTDQRGSLNYLAILARSLQRIIGGEIGAELGLSTGFSALDGD